MHKSLWWQLLTAIVLAPAQVGFVNLYVTVPTHHPGRRRAVGGWSLLGGLCVIGAGFKALLLFLWVG